MFLDASDALTKGVSGAFLAGYGEEAQANLQPLISSYMPSNSDEETFGWMGEAPQMLSMVDELEIKQVDSTTYTITNDEFAVGMAVKRKDIEDEKWGAIATRSSQLGRVAARHPNKLLIAALVAGDTDACYDGDAFFSTHSTRGEQTATQSNLLTQTGTSTANVKTDLGLALKAMRSFKAENNEPYNEAIRNVAIVAHPNLEGAMMEAIYGQLLGGGDSNVALRNYQIVPYFSSRLSDEDEWYMLDVTSSGLRPLIFQDRRPLTFTAQTDPSSDSVFYKHAYNFKVDWRGKVGYGP